MKTARLVFIGFLAMMLTTGCFSSQSNQTAEGKVTESNEPADKPTTVETPSSEKEKEEPKSSVKQESSVAETSNSTSVTAAPDASHLKSNSEKESQTAIQAVSPPPAPTGQPSSATLAILTEEQIKDKYLKELASLQSHYSGRLQALYGGAVTDYKANPDSKTAIYSKYSKQGNKLQEESQAKVNQVLYRMKNELKSNNYPLHYVDELRSSYYGEIDNAKSKVLGEVKQALGM